MADYTQPEQVERRLRYFDGQFLRDQDFVDEQRYHLDRGRRLARIVHTPGVLEGLAVTPVRGAPKVTVAPGTALDGRGRLLVRVDAGEPLDLTRHVNRDGPVAVLVALSYAEVEADAPQGGASPRWREAPEVTAFLDGDPDAPPQDSHPRLARVTLHPDGTATVDAEPGPTQSGLRLPGPLAVAGPASFAGGIDGAPDPLRVRGALRVTGDPDADGTTRLDLTNGATDFGRTNLVITGRLQDGNDDWNFGSAARTSLVFARNSSTSGQDVGADGEEQVSVQLEGRSGTLGVLTRSRGAEPALVVAQDGAVGVGTPTPGATLDVAGELAVSGGAALSEVGRWSAYMLGGSAGLRITIAPGSRRNIIVVRRRNERPIANFGVEVPEGTVGQWYARFTCYDHRAGQLGEFRVLPNGPVMVGFAGDIPLSGGAQPYVLVVEAHQITVLDL